MINSTCKNCKYGERQSVGLVKCHFWEFDVQNYTPDANVFVSYPESYALHPKHLIFPIAFSCGEWEAKNGEIIDYVE